MLNNLRIRLKTLLAFGSIILMTFCIIVALLGEMTSIAKTTQQLYNEPYMATDAMWIVRRNLVDTQRALYRLMSASDNQLSAAMDSTVATIDTDHQQMEAALESVRELLLETDTDMIALIEEIESGVAQGEEIKEQVLSLMRQGQRTQAVALLDGTYVPLFNSCNESVMKLFDIIEGDAVNFVEDANASSRKAIIVGIVVLIIATIAAVGISGKFSYSIVRPVRQLESAAKEMTRGNLKAANLITYHSKNELGQLADSLRFTMTTLSAYIDEISAVLMRLSQGDLTVEGEAITEFLGDFSNIKHSMVTILKSFNGTLGEISLASRQVETGASQVSNAAQLLSNGATEQAAAIEELTITVGEISEQIRDNATNAQHANDLTGQVDQEVQESTQQMAQMNQAMGEISSASEEIGKIIKTIEDIAFQTNILALNAAVEAARAGAAGKGFAVVADEVRNLASKSAEASKSTAMLIESSVKAVENGTSIAATTAKALETVAATTRQVVDTVTSIAQASSRQAASVEQVTIRVEQISNVVQQNSATAEESASASEELSGQAEVLNRQVAHFELFGQKNASRISSGKLIAR